MSNVKSIQCNWRVGKHMGLRPCFRRIAFRVRKRALAGMCVSCVGACASAAEVYFRMGDARFDV